MSDMSIFTRSHNSTEDYKKKENNKKKPIILHLDDDRDFLDIFVLVFNEWLDITSVCNGESALQFLKEKHFDAVITDYDMPCMDGLQFLKELRKTGTEIPVLFYTGQGNEEVAREAFIMGATDYFTKDLYSFAHKEKFVNSIRNAVQKNRTEKAKEESEGKFRELFHNVSDAIFLYKIENGNKPGKFIEVNDVACRRLGYSREEFLKMTPVDINAFLQESQVNSFLEEIASKGRITLESTHKTKDGIIIPVEISSHIITLNNEKAVLSVARDISERLKHREILKENEIKFRLLYEEAPMPYQSLDQNGNFLAVNNTWLEQLGYSKKEVIGKNFGDFVVPANRVLFTEAFNRFKKKGEVHNRIFEMVKKDGGIITVEFEGKIARDEDGNFQQTHCIFQDISQRMKDEKKIRHLNRVLKAIRNVNQLIVKEKNRDDLVGKACELLIETNGYNSSWVVLMNENRNFIKLYEAGVMSRSGKFYKDIESGTYPGCILSAMETEDVIVITMKEGTCSKCQEQETEITNTRMSVRLEYDGRFFGVLVVSIPSEISVDEEERSLFREVADDIAYALNNLETEENNRRTSNSLAYSQEILKEIFNNINSGIAVYEAVDNGEDFIFRKFNKAARKIEKVREEDILGRKVTEAFPRVREFGLFKVFQRVWQTGVPEHHEVNYYSDNRIKGWRDNFVFKLSTGEIVAIYDDVTEQKRNEESLRKNKELFRKILNTVPACVFIKDREGKYILANDYLGSLFGFAPDEITGKADRDLIADRLKGEEETTGYLADDRKILDGTSDSITRKEKYTNREGKIRYFQTTKVPISVNEERDSVLGVGMDITDLHDLSESLRIRDIAMKTSLNGIAMADFDGRLTYVNDTFLKLWGYDRKEEALGRYAYEFWADKNEANKVTEAVKSAGQWTGELEAKRKDGSTFYAHLMTNIIKDTDGVPLCLSASFTDISERLDIEKTARASKEKLDCILETIPYGVQELDLSGKIIYANQAYHRIYGYENDELTGKYIYQLPYLEENRKQLRDYLEKIRTGEMVQTPYFSTNVKKDGSLIDVQVDWQYKRNENGELTGFISIISDITEKNLINKALRESEEKYKSIFENTGTAIAIIEEDMTVSLINSEYERLSGYKASEVEGKMSALKTVHPDDREIIAKNHRNRRKADQTLPRQYEFRFYTKSEETKYVLLTVDMIPGTTQSIASMIDITHLKEIEQELRKSRNQLKSIIKNMPVMMDAFDENLVLSEWNRECERVTGFTAEEMAGNPDAMNLLYPDEEYRNNVIKTLNKMHGDFRDLEIELTCKNSNKKTISWSNISGRFPIPGWNSWAIGVDVTYRKEMESILLRKNRELNDFAHTVSHDLKNPLFIIMGFLNIIKDNPLLFDTHFDKIINKLKELMCFVDNLLSLSRAGKIIDKKEKIDFSDLLYTNFLRNGGETANAEIILPDRGKDIKADRAGVNSIFSNLITNSFRYRDPEKDKLIIEADYINEGNTVTIIYRDNGIGISHENLEKIFDPGFTVSKNKGTGFGLPIAKKITEAHGGTISAHSEGVGKGMEFRIKLPAE